MVVNFEFICVCIYIYMVIYFEKIINFQFVNYLFIFQIDEENNGPKGRIKHGGLLGFRGCIEHKLPTGWRRPAWRRIGLGLRCTLRWRH